MSDIFESYARQVLPQITDEQLQQFRVLAIVKKLRKRQAVLHEGEVCKHKIFVVSGLLRNYRLGLDGSEYIMRFAAEGNWITEPESLMNGTPSQYFIDALEASEIMMWNYEAFETLRSTIPGVSALSDRILNQTISLTQKRVLMNISSTPEERYLDFIATFPLIFSRVPLHMIASYLGVSRETLTRVRQSLAVGAKEE